MARPTNQSNQWDYMVKQMAFPHPVTGLPTKILANVRTDSNEILGCTSEQYGLVQNRDLIGVAVNALAQMGLTGYEQKVMVTDGGARVFAEFTFKLKLLAKAVGDKFGFRFIIKNSFDRSIRAALELGFLRLTCLNGASTLEREFSATRKHSTLVTVDFVSKAIEEAIKRGPEALKVYERLAEKALDDEKGLLMLANLEERGLLSGTLREQITTLWLAPRREEDKARNMYNLYNAVTEHVTHKVAPDRYEYAQKVSGGILSALFQAATVPAYMTKLLTPLPSTKVVMAASGPIIEV